MTRFTAIGEFPYHAPMPSMGDSIVIFLLALMLFGPKKLPQLARQLGKLMAEFRKASNDFRMQMEDELRIEEQKEHQAKVDALAPPPSSTLDPTIPTEDPPHPHLPAAVPESTPEPIAESGDLKIMPPTSGLPLESSARARTHAIESGPAETTSANNGLPHIEQHSIGGGLAATVNGNTTGAGLSSEEPSAEVLPQAPPPDRSHPLIVGEAERATHV